MSVTEIKSCLSCRWEPDWLPCMTNTGRAKCTHIPVEMLYLSHGKIYYYEYYRSEQIPDITWHKTPYLANCPAWQPKDEGEE